MNEIIGILGLQGWGKTALTTGFGYLAYLNGYKIYSNYPLSFDYTPVETIKDAENCRNGYLLLDEIWRWVHARTSQSNINKTMMGICLLNRKRNISIVYNTQLARTIDVILRDVTSLRYIPHLVLHDDDRRYIHYIARDLLDRESDEAFFNMPIDELGELFNTRYEVKNLENKPYYELSKKIENNCLNAINKLKRFKATVLPNSGKDTVFKGDLLISTPKGNYLGDVKSTSKDRITICNPDYTIKGEMNNFIKNAKQWNMKPILLYPKINKDGNYLNFPNNWFVYEVKEDSYLLTNRSHQLGYNKLRLKSVLLKNWLN